MQALRHVVLTSIVAVSLVLLAGPREAHAEVRVGPHAGYSFDLEQGFAGVDAWFGLTSLSDNLSLNLNPAFSYYFMPESVSYWSLDVNVPFLFKVPSLSAVSPYAAAGLAVRHTSVSADLGGLGSLSVSDTNFGFNLIAGALFLPDSFVNPFAQIKLTLADATDVAIMGGALFTF